MGTRIDNIVGDIFRISQWGPEPTITFNQFLIADERPNLIHTGRYGDYENVCSRYHRSAAARVGAFDARWHIAGERSACPHTGASSPAFRIWPEPGSRRILARNIVA